MRKTATILTAVLLLAAVPASAQRLTVVHVNDTHSHLEPERSGNTAGKGGVIERAAYLDSLRHAVGKNNVLLLHGGDWDQGTPYFTMLDGFLEANLINALKYDCVTIGNHEFDNGIEALCERVKIMGCPVVCANYDFSPFELGKYVTPYTIVRRGGLKIGIVGALCDISTVVARDTADRIPAFDTKTVVNKWASFLKDEKKCDMVILLSHLGYHEDMELIPETGGIDLVVGGHSHTLLKGFSYAVDRDGKTVPVIQDGSWGISQGVIEID